MKLIQQFFRWLLRQVPFFRRKGYGISLLMPFRSDGAEREAAYQWLVKYWKAHLPFAQFITGTDDQVPFSKTSAFNDAFSRSKGDILVLIDADCYIDAQIVVNCAEEIRTARKAGHKLWHIPYRQFYRLTDLATSHVLASNPAHPLRFSASPNPRDTEDTGSSSFGHWWGALIQVMPREAYELVGGCDPRFRGWGGEDVAFMRAIDTLYGKHKTTDNQVIHLWHPTIKTVHKLKLWDGQISPQDNVTLTGRYYAAFGDPRRMRRLVNEYQDGERPK